jgi:hypothetical protein
LPTQGIYLFIHLLIKKITEIIRLRTINQLIFAMEMQPVYHGVGTELFVRYLQGQSLP